MRTWMIGLVGLVTVGCAGSVREQRNLELARRASIELGCPMPALELQPGAGGKTAVHGCGLDATYVWSDDAGWTRDARRANR